jgi:hypothetical protein
MQQLQPLWFYLRFQGGNAGEIVILRARTFCLPRWQLSHMPDTGQSPFLSRARIDADRSEGCNRGCGRDERTMPCLGGSQGGVPVSQPRRSILVPTVLDMKTIAPRKFCRPQAIGSVKM